MAFCTKCGAEISDNAAFSTRCAERSVVTYFRRKDKWRFVLNVALK